MWFFVGTNNGHLGHICCGYGLRTNLRSSVRRRCLKSWSNVFKLIEITTTKEAGMNDKSGWKKEECIDLKYQNKNYGHGQAKQGFNASQDQKTKCGICGLFNHLKKDCRYKDYQCNNCYEKGHLSTVCIKGKKEMKIIKHKIII